MIKLDNEEKKLKGMFSKINVDSSKLKSQVISKIQTKEIVSKQNRPWLRPLIAVTASLMLVVSVAAATLGGFDWFIEKMNPHFGGIIEPVETYSQDQGIRIEVIGAQKYDNKAIIYLSLQDISGQERVTSQTEFLDGLDIKREREAGGVFLGETMLYFDEDTSTAYYEFNVTADSDSPLADPLEIGISRIYTHIKVYEDEPVDISLADIGPGETIPLEENQIWGGSGDAFEKASLFTKALKPGKYADMPHGEKDQWVSNVGIIGGNLHVQIGQTFNKEFGSTDVNLALEDPDGKLIFDNLELALFADENHQFLSRKKYDYSHASYKYKEVIIPIDTEDLSNYEICFTGSVESGIEGDWNVVINLKDANQNMIIIKNDISIGDQLFEHISLSPLGLQVIGSYQGDEDFADKMILEIESTDGNIILNFGGGNINPVKKKFKLNWGTKESFDMNTVKAIVIDGIRIKVE